MADELTTINYGWTKPTVDGSDDAWGGYINTDLDGIDRIVKGVSVVANAAYPASNPSGYQTAAQVASVVIGDNRIINGDMRIDQRNNGASGTASQVYTVDRWFFSSSQTSKGNWGRSGPGAPGFPYFVNFVSSSVYTLVAGDTFGFYQPIEADMISDFQWGTAGAQPVTLSFWASSSLTGTFGGSLRNAATNRSYPFTYSLPDTAWHKFAITIPGDTVGTWTLSGNGVGVYVNFSLGCGATFSGSANAWAATNYTTASGCVSVVGTNGAYLTLTGVKLEIGSVATPFNRQSLAKSMADCQRYYWQTTMAFNPGGNAASSGNQDHVVIPHPVTMRATPTLSSLFSSTTNCTASVTADAQWLRIVLTATVAGSYFSIFNSANTQSAEL